MLLDQSNAMLSEEIYNHEKSPEEIKELIEKALVDNKILGYLHGKILYMKSFGRNTSPDKIVAGIGALILYIGFPDGDLPPNLYLIIIGGFLLALGSLVSWLVKHYLVYDIDREIFYTITNLFNITIFRSKEIHRRDIVELGVDVIDKDNEGNVNSYVHSFNGNILDNPGLKTSFIALTPDGSVESISDPQPKRAPHEVAVARCRLFGECFGVKSVICSKTEALKIIKEENNRPRFEKYSKLEEWKEAKKSYKNGLWVALTIIIIGVIILIYLFSR